MWVLLEICVDVTVPIYSESLRTRLSPGSPLVVGLEYIKAEGGASRYVLLEALQGMPSCLSQGASAAEALVALFEGLGGREADSVVWERLEQKLSVQHALHWFAVADWLQADTCCKMISAWLLKMWMQSTHALVRELASVDESMLQAAVRSGIFRMASISENALLKFAKASRLKVLVRVLSEGLSERERNEAIDLEEEDFSIFVKSSGQSLVVHNCTADMTVLALKDSVASRDGSPQACLRLVYAGKPLEDSRSLGECGIYRDSTVIACLASHVVIKPELPRRIQVQFSDACIEVAGSGREPDAVRTSFVELIPGDTVADVASRALHHVFMASSHRGAWPGCLAPHLVYEGNQLCSTKNIAMYKLPENALLDVILPQSVASC